MTGLTHIDKEGAAHMVDVGSKDITLREAIATATILMRPDTLHLITTGEHKKGDVLAVARIAGIQAAKRCSELIPLCHPLLLTAIKVTFEPNINGNGIDITATAGLQGKTGVEMEALTAVSCAALTIYDMCKAVDRGMEITTIRLLDKKGGKSGHWRRFSF